MGQSEEDITGNIMGRTMMCKFGVNAYGAMKQFANTTNNSKMYNPWDRSPHQLTCVIANHAMPVPQAKPKAKPKPVLPEMSMHGTPPPQFHESTKKSMSKSSVPAWISSIEAEMVQNMASHEAIAIIPATFKCFFTFHA